MRYVVRFLSISLTAGLVLAVSALVMVPVASGLRDAGTGETAAIDLNPLPERSLVLDSKGNVIASLHEEENRSPVTLDQVPQLVRDAVLAVEDETFYSHSGVNLTATIRALITNVESGGVEQGGSTITMQLVKNALLTPERQLSRKIQEAVLARRLEDEMTKDQILERYLNTVYFGNHAYGIQAAAETYFGKGVGQLEWPEAALLAAMIRNPNGYDPFLHPSLAVERRRIALQRLVETGHLTQEQADVYSFTPLPSAPSTVGAPPQDYFVEAVKNQLLSDPSFGLGTEYTQRANAVFKGGLRITTTLDPDLQAKALYARAVTLPDGDPNGLFTINGSPVDVATTCPKLNDGDSRCKGTIAMVSVEPATGAVREVVGGPGFENWKYDLALDAQRQPGSSMKPYVLVTALEHGISALDTIDGRDCSFNNKGGTPNPYKVPGEAGVATLISQMAGSVNCAYLRLGQVVGTDNVVDQAKKMGVRSPLSANIALPLGTSPVTPLEQAAAYASIANGGVYNEPWMVSKITDAEGNVLYEHTAAPKRVMSQETAAETTQALKAVVTGGTATRARLSDRDAAGKTGTTQKHGDAWFVGFTPQLATAVWMGSPEATVPLNNVGGINVFGGTFPALVWHNFMVGAMDGLDAIAFPTPHYTHGGKYLQTPKGVETNRSPFPVGPIGGGGTLTTRPPGSTAPPASTSPTTAPPPTDPPATTAPPTTNPPPGGGGPGT